MLLTTDRILLAKMDQQLVQPLVSKMMRNQPVMWTSTWAPGIRKHKLHGDLSCFPLWALRWFLLWANNPHSHLKPSLKKTHTQTNKQKNLGTHINLFCTGSPQNSFDGKVLLLNRSLKITKAPEAEDRTEQRVEKRTYALKWKVFKFIKNGQLLTPSMETQPNMH